MLRSEVFQMLEFFSQKTHRRFGSGDRHRIFRKQSVNQRGVGITVGNRMANLIFRLFVFRNLLKNFSNFEKPADDLSVRFSSQKLFEMGVAAGLPIFPRFGLGFDGTEREKQ